jgi:hypothetical protein
MRTHVSAQRIRQIRRRIKIENGVKNTVYILIGAAFFGAFVLVAWFRSIGMDY